MDLAHKPYKLLITGASGSGKSTYWTRYITGTAARIKFVFDHEGEFAYRHKIKPAVTIEELAAGTGHGWAVYDPSVMFAGRLGEGFDFFCDFAFQVSSSLDGRKLFCCDELQKLVGTNQVSPELALVLETGRRYGLDVALITQQPNLVHNRIRNQLTEVVSFRQIDAAPIQWLEGAGFKGEELSALPNGRFVARNLLTGGQATGLLF